MNQAGGRFSGDGLDDRVELDTNIFGRPGSRILVRMEGESFRKVGVLDGYLVVADRSLEPANKQLVVAIVGGRQIVKRLMFCEGRRYLIVDDVSSEAIEIDKTSGTNILAVITSIIPVISGSK
jgi:DNA polymerase V